MFGQESNDNEYITMSDLSKLKKFFDEHYNWVPVKLTPKQLVNRINKVLNTNFKFKCE
jgi:hypothetical protein